MVKSNMILTLVIAFMGRTTPFDDFPGFVIAEADGKVLSMSAPAELAPEARLDTTFSKAHFKTMVYFQVGKFHESGRIDRAGQPLRSEDTVDRTPGALATAADSYRGRL